MWTWHQLHKTTIELLHSQYKVKLIPYSLHVAFVLLHVRCAASTFNVLFYDSL